MTSISHASCAQRYLFLERPDFKRRLAAIAAILLLSAPISFARAANPPPSPLSWDQCVQAALQANPDVASAHQNVESKLAFLRGTYNGYLPRLNFSATYERFGPVNNTPSPQWLANGSASMDILNLADPATVATARAGLEQAEASLRDSSAAVRFSLRKAYADLLFAQEAIEVSKRIVDLRSKNSEMVTLRYNSGRESKGNMMRAKAELFQSDADLRNANRELRSAQHSLAQQLGLNEFQQLTVLPMAPPAPLSDPEPNFEPLIDTRPDVRLAQAGLDVADGDLLKSKSVVWPTLTANYVRGFQGPRFFPGDQEDWTLSGVLNLPIFSGGPSAAYYSIKGSRRAVQSAEESLRSVRNSARTDLAASWTGLASSADQVQVQHALLSAARQRNDEADIRYTSGLLAYDNWELIVTDRVNFERSAIRAEHDAIVASGQWEQSAGKLLEDRNE